MACVLCGCGKICSAILDAVQARSQTARAKSIPSEPSNSAPSVTLPAAVVVETEEAKDAAELSHQVKELFKAGEYEKLDALAQQLRESKQEYVTGKRKLTAFYAALTDLDDQGPDAMWEFRIKELKHWAKGAPASPTPRVALADLLTKYAWKARGSGWANTVTEQGWKQFRDRLVESAKVLSEVAKMETKCPVLYSVAARVGLGLGFSTENYEKLFTEATQVDPAWLGPYFSKCYFLLPRWHGKPGDWEWFVLSEAASRKGDAGDIFYARMIWRMDQDGPLENVFKESSVEWPRVKRGFEALRKQHPGSVTVTSAYAKLAILAGDRDTARELMQELAGKADLATWETKAYFEKCQLWAAALPAPPAQAQVYEVSANGQVKLNGKPLPANTAWSNSNATTKVAAAKPAVPANQPRPAGTASSGRTVKLKDGRVISGRIKAIIGEQVLIQTEDGQEIEVTTAQLAR